ncbi:MAG: poly(3-hydroxyalkanoate) depolymerase [Acetobacteraceae bacterium]|nr:poly(3-hydroxyalkanoate) depolymerase [Acetobacteraceae bacterium]
MGKLNMETRSVDIDGQVLRVGVRAGSGITPPLLIFNGIGANLELVAPFVAALDGVETIIFDIPGIGGSPLPPRPYRLSHLARLAERLLAKLGYPGQVDVIGVSWGGALAQEFAHLYPDRCRRLILASTSPGTIMVPGKLSTLAKLISPRRYRDPEFLHAVGGELYGGAYRRDPGLLREHGRHIRPPGGRGYFYQLFGAWGWTSIPWLWSLRQPTLVMHGKDDPIVPLINAKILAWLIRKAKLHVVDDGHLFLISRATEVAPVVRRFLTEDAS